MLDNYVNLRTVTSLILLVVLMVMIVKFSEKIPIPNKSACANALSTLDLVELELETRPQKRRVD